MKLWVRANSDVVFKVTKLGYALIKAHHLPVSNKKVKIREVDIISLASSLSIEYPTFFFAMYYSEKIVYWHELRELIKCVCA